MLEHKRRNGSKRPLLGRRKKEGKKEKRKKPPALQKIWWVQTLGRILTETARKKSQGEGGAFKARIEGNTMEKSLR